MLNRTAEADGGAGRCVFLDDDTRCALHAAHGPEAKPATCRVFPFSFVDTPAGIFAGLSFACTAVLLDWGPLVSTQETAVREALALAHPRRVGNDELRLVPGVPIDWGEYEQIEAALREIRDAAGAGTSVVLEAQVAWLRRRAEARGARVGSDERPAISGDRIDALARRAGGSAAGPVTIDAEALIDRYFAHRLFRKDLLREPDLVTATGQTRADLAVVEALIPRVGAVEAVRVVEQQRVLHAERSRD